MINLQHDNPLVSVLMTVYNREKVLASSIESVLDSTYTNFELIIVDDCSTDSSYSIAEKYASMDSRIRLYKNEENKGDYPNRNVAAQYARGKYIKYNDSDEEMYYFGLKIMVECMEMFPDAAVGFSKLHENEKLPVQLTPEEAYQEHCLNKPLFINAPSSSIIRREPFEKEGRFREIRHRGDYDLWLRMCAKYPVVLLPAYLCWNYLHEGQELSYNLTYKKALSYNLTMEALNSKDCPLNEEDRAKAIARYKRGFIRNNIFRNVMKFNFSEVSYLMKNTKIGFGEVLGAIS